MVGWSKSCKTVGISLRRERERLVVGFTARDDKEKEESEKERWFCQVKLIS